MFKQFLLYASFIIFLTACSSRPQVKPAMTNQSASDRIAAVEKLNHWRVRGKMAIIQGSKRQSASLNWLYNQDQQTQELDLTTFLGINILSIHTSKELHTVTVDGKSYQGRNLQEIVYQLTGMVLPTQALSSWIKGIPYQQTDKVTYAKNNTPSSISSFLENRRWTISYANYEVINQTMLPKKITLEQQGIKIKLAINHWTVI